MVERCPNWVQQQQNICLQVRDADEGGALGRGAGGAAPGGAGLVAAGGHAERRGHVAQLPQRPTWWPAARNPGPFFV